MENKVLQEDDGEQSTPSCSTKYSEHVEQSTPESGEQSTPNNKHKDSSYNYNNSNDNSNEAEPLLENKALVKIEEKREKVDKRNLDTQMVIDSIKSALND